MQREWIRRAIRSILNPPLPTLGPAGGGPAAATAASVVRVVLEEPRQPLEVGAGLDEADDGDQGLGVDQRARTGRS